jgi:hypothetical protein
MERYWRRLERTQIKICILLTVLLFGGLLTLPWIGQVIWIVVIMAIYIRVILVIARKHELLEELQLRREDDERTAWYDASERRILLSDFEGNWASGIDAGPGPGQPADPCRRTLKRAEAVRRLAIEGSRAPPDKRKRGFRKD